ncbi:MAG: DUF4147 domain-containing protein [Candidatus Paceibacterota bacterium]
MNERLIKNFDDLATTENRKIALEIIEAGLGAINTSKVISSLVSLTGDVLSVAGKKFDLTKYKNIKVVGFGKSSCEGALAIEKILGARITSGAVIGLQKADCKYIETFAGTHPKPSEENIKAGEKIYEIINGSKEDDLIIVLVSGGGSSLLCYPESEYKEGARLYDAFLKSGKTITEINTVRKHLSLFKGGGLAKIAYPATIVGLIFSDIPGNDFKNVASGATYKDDTTIEDAQKIIIENNLGEFNLIETPKEDKYFENVFNFILVSDKTAVDAMAQKSREFNLGVNILSTELYDEVDEALGKIFKDKSDSSVVLAAGEPRIVVKKEAGKGGRSLHMALSVVAKKLINKEDFMNSVFISFASDGMDNSDAAGAIVDKNTIEKIEKLNLNVDDALERFDSYPVFEKSGDMIMTGPTGANVSDLMLLLTKKNNL